MKKNFFAAGAVLLAAAFVGQTASAKTLEDILKEKGVITEADYKEVTKTKAFDYKLGKGVTFTSADEKFQTSIGGRMQYRYTFLDKNPTGADSSKWEAKRIRLIVQGYAFTKDLTYKMEIDPVGLASEPGKGGLLDCFVNYKVMDELQILAGQTKVKYGYTMVMSDGNLMFVDRVPWITSMVPAYEIGAFVYGKVANGLVDYAVSATNGDGQTNSANYNHNAFAARVQVSPFGPMVMDEHDLAISKKPLMTLGLNYFYNDLNQAIATTAAENSGPYGTAWNGFSDLQNYGVDAHFKWMGLSLQAEGLFTQGEAKVNNPAAPSTPTTLAGQTRRAVGWYAQAGYMVTPKIGFAYRYSQFDPNRDRGNDLQFENIGAASYYFSNHNLKLQADVAHLHNQVGDTDDMQYRLQVQLVF